MAKFSIECPSCGKYAQASTNFFARKKIACVCGYTIDVRTDKFSSKVCSHCGNQIMYDQSKGANAKCPVCHENVNTLDDNRHIQIFSCAQCGVRLETSSSASMYTCPVCDFVNNVSERLTSEKIQRDGLASIIKYEGDNNTFVWKHPIEDFNYGSQLIVHESQEAIFLRDGQALDLFGAGRYTLETQNLPMMERIYRLPTDTTGTFHSEVYFINKTVQMAIKWGTPDKVRFIDPILNVPLEIGASGEMNIMVSDSRKLLLKLVGTMKELSWDEGPGFTKSLQASFRPLIVSAVKTNLAAVIKSENIDILEIDSHLDIISNTLREKIVPGFEEYGLTIPQLYVTGISLPPDSDPIMKEIRALHTVNLKTAQAAAETKVRMAEEESKAAIESAHRQAELQKQITQTEIARQEAERRIIAAQADAQTTRLTGYAEAEVMQAKGYTQRDVLQAEVQKAYAEGIGNMGPDVQIGGGNNLASEMMGLGVGMAAAGAIAPQLGGMMQNAMPSMYPNNAYGQVQPMAGGMGQVQPMAGGMGRVQPMVGGMGQVQPMAGGMGQVQPMAGGMGQVQQMQADKNAMSPTSVQPTPGVVTMVNPGAVNSGSDSWDCSCGLTGIVGNFCNNCGNKKPQPAAPETWDCSCGLTGIVGNFCNNCGSRKPQPEVPATWDCSCGLKGIVGNFCNNCGSKRG